MRGASGQARYFAGAAGVYEFFMCPLRHFYGFCLSIDLSLWDTRQQGQDDRNRERLCEVGDSNPGMNRKRNVKDMSTLTLKQIDVQSDAKDSSAQAVRPRILIKIYSGGAIMGLFGSAVGGVFGAILTAASWFVTKDGGRQFLSATGSVLLYLTIPLIVIAAFCLDWMEKDKSRFGSKAARQKYEEDDDQ
jgi:hypothetical protein